MHPKREHAETSGGNAFFFCILETVAEFLIQDTVT